MEGFIGEVKLFAGTFAPRGWYFCEGQLLAIQEHTTLYSIIGDQFGGDGRTSFGLPDLRGRTPIGVGTGKGLTPRYASQYGGFERIALSVAQMPSHNHTINCDMTSVDRSKVDTPEGKIPAKTADKNYGSDMTGGHQMHEKAVNSAGGGAVHENMQPWLALHYIICYEGEYPQRP